MKIYLRTTSDGEKVEYTFANKGNGKETHLAKVETGTIRGREFDTVGHIACGTGDYHYYTTAKRGLRSKYDPYAKEVTCQKCLKMIEQGVFTDGGDRQERCLDG